MDNRGLDALQSTLKENSFTGSKEYFTLEDDGDSATVIFLHGDDKESPLNLDYAAVYKVDLPIEGENKTVGKYIKVIDAQTDPLAKANFRKMVRALFQLVEVTVKDGEVTYSDVKIWDRGQMHISQLVSIMQEMGPLHNYPVKITRDGKRGDRNTKYHILALAHKSDMVDKEKLPEPANLTQEGRYIMELTQEEMQQVVDGEYFLESYSKEDGDQTKKSGGTVSGKVSTAFNKKPETIKKEKPKKPAPPQPIYDEDSDTWINPIFNSEKWEWEFPNQSKESNSAKNVF